MRKAELKFKRKGRTSNEKEASQTQMSVAFKAGVRWLFRLSLSTVQASGQERLEAKAVCALSWHPWSNRRGFKLQVFELKWQLGKGHWDLLQYFQPYSFFGGWHPVQNTGMHYTDPLLTLYKRALWT